MTNLTVWGTVCLYLAILNIPDKRVCTIITISLIIAHFVSSLSDRHETGSLDNHPEYDLIALIERIISIQHLNFLTLLEHLKSSSVYVLTLQ